MERWLNSALVGFAGIADAVARAAERFGWKEWQR